MLTVKIDGMMCNHCTSRVEGILNEIEGVSCSACFEDFSKIDCELKEIDLIILGSGLDIRIFKKAFQVVLKCR